MEKIIQLLYQNRSISIEENAYQSFLNYETELKNYFLKEEDGEETFSDLQNRMAEIFEEKLKNGKVAIQQTDIDELIANIGKPNEFETNENTNQQEDTTKQTKTENATKKLFRNKDKSNRIIAGVCSGIANYMQMDPIAIRLIFVLFAFFNIITFFKLNLAVIAYIILWAVLPVTEKAVNVNQKFFRNPKDKVLGGICSGLAQFFNTESWIVRAIFLFPLLIGIFSQNSHHIFHGNDFFHVHSLTENFASLSFIIYVILWIISPVAQSTTDYMQLKGEPININSIQNSTAKESISKEANNGLNKFLKIVAYIFIGFFLMVSIPTSFGFFVGGLFMFKIASIVLFTSYYKALALIALFGFIAMPLISLIVWIFRRIAGYRSQNRVLRITFSTISLIGFLCGAMVVFHLVSEMNSYVGIKKKFALNTTSDTLFVNSMQEDTIKESNVIFDLNTFNHLVNTKNESNEIKAVRLKYAETEDSVGYVLVEQTAFGSNSDVAEQNSQQFTYEPIIENNQIKLASFITLSNKIPYRMQNVVVTIVVPKHKNVVVSKKLKQELSKTFRANKKGFNVHFDDDFDKENKYETIKSADEKTTTTTTINDDGITVNTSTNDEKQSAEETEKEKQEAIKQAQQDLAETQKEATQQLKEAQKEYEEKQKEAKQQIEEAQKELDKKMNKK